MAEQKPARKGAVKAAAKTAAKGRPAATAGGADKAPSHKPRRRREHAFPRVQIRIGDEMVLGPGKVELLEAIGRTGSISAAGRELGMSYRRAWLLVDALNRMFPDLLVKASPGGSHGGGAKLTEYGMEVAAAYRRVEERARIAMQEEMARFNVRVDSD
ncbi:winged helix-turn-helix domain-containing protein [Hyphomicrobium sp. D-2]|uniref:winged helix-turn-helix domain-containing protein n=1 Tax=Hyphomicrobium sp. D-2 TaxID=3041621 RepID=UPI0032AF456F